MKFIGAIAFLDTVNHENRDTTVMNFDVASDWFASVKEHWTQAVMTGAFDGTEVLINVYQYDGSAKYFERVENEEYTQAIVVKSHSIMNPYYA